MRIPLLARYLALAVLAALFALGGAAAWGLDDRVERRRQDMALPDEYLDPGWPLPPILSPTEQPAVEGEDDSAAGGDAVEEEDLGLGDSVMGEPFEDLLDHLSEEVPVEEDDEAGAADEQEGEE
jgi:hypothetical protein